MSLTRKEELLQSTSACSLNIHTETWCLIMMTFLLKLCGFDFSLDQDRAADIVAASQLQVPQIDPELQLLSILYRIFTCSPPLGFLHVLWFPPSSKKHSNS